jgi:DNA-binding IclR family transcriptional regulator
MLGTVTKAGQVLDVFTPECPEWGVTEVADRLGLSKSNAHELLASLASIDLLQRTPRARYRLGWRVVSMAGGLAEATLLRKHAPPHLEALACRGGQTTHLGVWDGREMFFVAQSTAKGGVDHPRASLEPSFRPTQRPLGRCSSARRPGPKLLPRLAATDFWP